LGKTKTNISLGNGGGHCMAYNTWDERQFFLMYYQMKFDVFNVLVEELTPSLKFECLNHARPQL
jgi:hypothetical protein